MNGIRVDVYTDCVCLTTVRDYLLQYHRVRKLNQPT